LAACVLAHVAKRAVGASGGGEFPNVAKGAPRVAVSGERPGVAGRAGGGAGFVVGAVARRAQQAAEEPLGGGGVPARAARLAAKVLEVELSRLAVLARGAVGGRQLPRVAV